MKVVWFTNIPFPQQLNISATDHSGAGGWMVSLLDQLIKHPDIFVYVITVAPRLTNGARDYKENVKFISVNQRAGWKSIYWGKNDKSKKYLKLCSKLLSDIQPDIIHIHGTERFYGLLSVANPISAPIVISIQGLLQEISKTRNFFGHVPLKSIARWQLSWKGLLGKGPIFNYLRFVESAKREVTIIEHSKFIFGRTNWDRLHVMAINPKLNYYHLDEMIRSAFWKTKWELGECERHRILIPSPNTLAKGIETIIEAVKLLRGQFHKITIAIPGAVSKFTHIKSIINVIEIYGWSSSVEFLGELNETEMAQEIRRAHVFVLTSTIENSPNSLCEAQLMGLPCIASRVGGIPSLIDNNRTGLLFPSGDAPILAETIRSVFLDDIIAKRISRNGREAALLRHNPERIVSSTIDSYQKIINEWKNIS